VSSGGPAGEDAPRAVPIADQVAEQLGPYLGPFNARVAVKTFCQRAFKLTPEALTIQHLPALLEALRPMLHTLVGRSSTDSLLVQIQRQVH
jgi:hypothetical protein